jgi:predicted acetyltransferase
MTLRLRPFSVKDEAAALAALEELEADDFSFLIGGWTAETPWADYLVRLDHLARGVNLPENFVPSVDLAAVVGEHLVGRTSIRLALNDFLRERGGHIGYAVRPGFRRRGYATEILRQSLVIIRSHGVERVLVTCAESNVGSATVIERCGGVFESHHRAEDGALTRRYWFE